tara:strand:+ start:486 stop:719 length:234 start_codon:yes stop_codon:yes gene_type:complete
MSTFERETREHLENLAFEKADLYNKHLAQLQEQKEIEDCEDTLIAYIGLDEFKKLSSKNVNMIVGAMQEYAENKVNE